jgi:hypothetical protein
MTQLHDADHSSSDRVDPVGRSLERVAQRLRWLTVAVFLAALAVTLCVAAVFGRIVDFHASEGMLIGGASAGAAIVGFLLGWLAARRG